MNNFEKTIESSNNIIGKEVFDKLNTGVEKYIGSKLNKFIVIIERADFNFNKAEISLEKKIDELKDELKSKFFSNIYLENIDDILKRKILKLSLEGLAEKKLNNSLSFYKSLEDKYAQILLEEAEFYLENSQSFEDMKDVMKFINKKKILDNNIQGDLINQIEKKYE